MMLTRLRYRSDFRVIVRYLADKPSDSDGKPLEQNAAPKNSPEQKSAEAQNAYEKLEELLKKMAVQSNIKRSEYSQTNLATAPEKRKRKQKNSDVEVKVEQIEESITKAAGDVAHVLGGDVKQTEAELLSKVLGKIEKNTTSLSDLIIGMKVDRTKEESEPETRGQQVKRLVAKNRAENQTRYAQRQERDRPDTDQKGQKSPFRRTSTPTSGKPQVMSIDIFAGQPLGIFKNQDPNYGTKLDTWEALKERELSLATTQPPANYFQKMILWTKQGKVWKFPIDNEQGFEQERDIDFSEHIFLDQHLEGWCPTKGPIRHFMELVCVGLSKNPFYTVQEKKDHIMWYKEYFESKKDLLSEVGVWGNVSSENKKAST